MPRMSRWAEESPWREGAGERKLQGTSARVICLEFRIGRERARRLWMASQWSVARCAQCVVFFFFGKNPLKKCHKKSSATRA
jgi:hypothetical protein